ncbi:MAG: tetratricopeptide repeat protein [Candidatus Omnitrophica bacterium]|nr:tetratricopeptide repeat protein [Candidatus Omnitrophota bacterium]
MTKEQLYQIGMLAAKEGHYPEALDFFNKAIAADPRYAPAYNGLGLIYESDGMRDPQKAARHFRMAVEFDPKYVEAWTNLGKLYYADGSFLPAEKAFVKSLEILPDQPEIEFTLAWVYLLGESKADEAIAAFEHAMSQQDNSAAYYGLGLAYLLKEDRFKVLDAITQLRHRGREDQALKLEDMLRKKVKLTSRPGSPLVTGTDTGPSAFQEQLSAMGDPADGNGGIKVRLRGPLPAP